MILTETVNVLESMRFLVTARHTLADICRSTKMENKEQAANYFINEASDYEVMHALVLGEMPEEKYNQEGELMLFGLLKQQLVESVDFIGESFIDRFIAEVNSIYPHYSTAKPIMEFQLMSEIGAGHPTGGKEGIGTTIMGKIQMLKQKMPSASAMAQQVSKFATSPAGLAVGGAALASLLAYGATKIYKRFLSQAAKACKGKSGAEKSACMAKAKADALKKQIADIKSGSAVCAKSKNPEACRAGVNKKIEKLKAKAAKMAA